MALTVEKLNADTTFLLAFAPSFAPPRQPRRFPGAFTILIDPWLDGHSSIFHPSFQISHHTSGSAITSLADLRDQPDLIIVSQDKPDHCHRASLSSMPHAWSTPILATPPAAKRIRSWKRFDPARVHSVKPYSPDHPDSVIRIRLAPYTSSCSPGEITIANVPTKRDVAGLHNAIAITYRPPGSLLTTAREADLLTLRHWSNPKPSLPKLRKSQSAVRLTRAFLRGRPPTPPPVPPMPPALGGEPPPTPLHVPLAPPPPPPPPTPGSPVLTGSRPRTISLPTPPGSPLSPGRPPPEHSTPPRVSSPNTADPVTSRPHREKTVSVLYTPHGIAAPVLDPYVTHHLEPMRALPLTAMFHCINQEENPWFMGGLVANGAPSGCELVRHLGARHWIGAHDELKDNRGVATAWIKSRRFHVDDVHAMLGDEHPTGVHVMEVGENLRISG